MWRYILRRLLSGVVTIWFIATATFFAMHFVPGDPLSSERAMSPEIRKNLQIKYGLDQPLAHQYILFLRNMLHGDFGISFTQQNRRVNDIIREHFPVSALLGIVSLIIATVGAVLWGAVSAHYRRRWPDSAIMLLVIVAVSLPGFVTAALVQWLVLALNRQWGFTVLPVAGWGTWKHLLLPAWVLGLSTMAYMTRLMRASLLEVAHADYLRTARAKGLSAHRIFFRHQLRNALLPVITVLGPAIAAITTGGFVVELMFAIPGLGRYFVEAVQQLDYTVIMGTTVFYGAFLVLMVLLVDIIYGVVDPRIRVAR
ncbi:MAG: transporter [Verrucomicrobiaceae bacterium]|nr:transporter [Verrucomicrobiaceae bacterium]